VVEPDLSNAAPFLAAALVTSGWVRVPGWPHDTEQPGDQLRHLLAAMGAACLLDDRGLTVHGLGRIQGLDADLHDVGELAPVLAAVAPSRRWPRPRPTCAASPTCAVTRRTGWPPSFGS
jgi:3-phosphoshikimate 1-carboxyvinyltransferase